MSAAFRRIASRTFFGDGGDGGGGSKPGGGLDHKKSEIRLPISLSRRQAVTTRQLLFLARPGLRNVALTACLDTSPTFCLRTSFRSGNFCGASFLKCEHKALVNNATCRHDGDGEAHDKPRQLPRSEDTDLQQRSFLVPCLTLQLAPRVCSAPFTPRAPP